MNERRYLQFFVEDQSGQNIYGIAEPFTLHINGKPIEGNTTAVQNAYHIEFSKNDSGTEQKIWLGSFPTYELAHRWADMMLDAVTDGSTRFSFYESRVRNWVTL